MYKVPFEYCVLQQWIFCVSRPDCAHCDREVEWRNYLFWKRSYRAVELKHVSVVNNTWKEANSDITGVQITGYLRVIRWKGTFGFKFQQAGAIVWSLPLVFLLILEILHLGRRVQDMRTPIFRHRVCGTSRQHCAQFGFLLHQCRLLSIYPHLSSSHIGQGEESMGANTLERLRTQKTPLPRHRLRLSRLLTRLYYQQPTEYNRDIPCLPTPHRDSRLSLFATLQLSTNVSLYPGLNGSGDRPLHWIPLCHLQIPRRRFV